MSVPGHGEGDLVARLMKKISEQATELSALNLALEESTNYIRKCETKIIDLQQTNSSAAPSDSFVDGALRRREERELRSSLDILKVELEQSESRYSSACRTVARLEDDLRAKDKDILSRENKISDLKSEIKKLKTQLEASLRVKNPFPSKPGSFSRTGTVPPATASTAAASSTGKGPLAGSTLVRRDELSRLRFRIDQCERDLEQSRRHEEELQLKAQVLEEALAIKSGELSVGEGFLRSPMKKAAQSHAEAELLSKLLTLKREVEALRREAEINRDKLAIAETEVVRGGLKELNESVDGTSREQSLHRQISILQQRLSIANEEICRLQSGEIAEKLNAATNERDVLLEFIQSDLAKSSVISEHAQRCEVDLSVTKHQLKDTEDRALKAEERLHSVEGALVEVQRRSGEVGESKAMLEAERNSLRMQADRIRSELEQVLRINGEVSVQNREREYELNIATEELRQLRGKLQVEEQARSSLDRDYNDLRSRLRLSEEETSSMRREIGSLEPKMHEMEPELTQLRKQRVEWMAEKRRLEEELDALRPLEQALTQLADDLDVVKTLPLGATILNPLPPPPPGVNSSESFASATDLYTDEQHRGYGRRYDTAAQHKSLQQLSSVSSSPIPKRGRSNVNRASTGSPIRSRSVSPDKGRTNTGGIPGNYSTHFPFPNQSYQINSSSSLAAATFLTQSQQHAAWASLPSLRRLSPALYDNIRKMSTDLHKIEGEKAELEAAVTTLRKELTVFKEEVDREAGRVSVALDDAQKMNEEYRERLARAESDLLRSRGAVPIVEQVKLALLSYPGGWTRLMLRRDHEDYQQQQQQERGHRDRSYGNSFLSSSQIYGDEDYGGNSYGERQQQGDRRQQQQQQRQQSQSEATDNDPEKIPDHLLPELIAKAIMLNASSVVELQDFNLKFNQLSQQLDRDKFSLQLATRETEMLRSQLDEQQRRLAIKERDASELQGVLRADIDSAAELAEKQNALTITLEARVESAKREMQLKAAQLTSLQQREDSIKERLHSLLTVHIQNAGGIGIIGGTSSSSSSSSSSPSSLPPVQSTSIPQLMQVLDGFLGRMVQSHTLRVASTHYAASSTAGGGGGAVGGSGGLMNNTGRGYYEANAGGEEELKSIAAGDYYHGERDRGGMGAGAEVPSAAKAKLTQAYADFQARVGGNGTDYGNNHRVNFSSNINQQQQPQQQQYYSDVNNQTSYAGDGDGDGPNNTDRESRPPPYSTPLNPHSRRAAGIIAAETSFTGAGTAAAAAQFGSSSSSMNNSTLLDTRDFEERTGIRPSLARPLRGDERVSNTGAVASRIGDTLPPPSTPADVLQQRIQKAQRTMDSLREGISSSNSSSYSPALFSSSVGGGVPPRTPAAALSATYAAQSSTAGRYASTGAAGGGGGGYGSVNRMRFFRSASRQLNHADKFAIKLKSLSGAASNDDPSSSILTGSELPSELEDVLKSFRDFLPSPESASQQKSPYDFKYSSSGSRGGHIVAQEFAYICRPDEEKLVCELMNERQDLRKDSDNCGDKMNNRLIAIPGSAGAGKSTFLVNFPDSDAYKEYIAERHGSIDPIVSTFSFNGLMSDGTLAPGLRVLFGAAKAMSPLARADSWNKFFNTFKAYKKLTILDALVVLRHVFGAGRPIVIAVDELVKANLSFGNKADKGLMAELCAALDSHGDVDVLVSSLSPQYVYSLVTNIQRKIDYVVLSPVMELGRVECLVWADKIIDAVEVDTKKDVDWDIQNLLRNCYLLYSGHPRAIEFMVKKFKSKEVVDAVVRLLKDDVSFSVLLFDYLPVILELSDFTSGLDGMPKPQLEKFVFSAGRYFYPSLDERDSAQFRKLLERGSIFVRSGPAAPVGGGPTTFASAVSSVSMLKWIVSPHELVAAKFPRTRAVVRLLKDLRPKNNKAQVATWWERLVAFTIVSRSFERMSLYEVFGISAAGSHLLEKEVFGLRYEIAEANIGYKGLPSASEKVEEEDNVLTVYDDNQAGFDAHALVDSKHFYLQAKLLFPDVKTQRTGEPVAGDVTAEAPVTRPEEPVMKKKSSDEIVAGALPFVLLSHLWQCQSHRKNVVDVDEEELPNKTNAEIGALLAKLLGKDSYPIKGKNKKQLVETATKLLQSAPITPQLTPPDDAAATLANVHYIVYNWGDDGPEQSPEEGVQLPLSLPQPSASKPLTKEGVKALLSKSDLTAVMIKVAKNTKCSLGVPEKFDVIVNEYLDNHFAENIHIVNRPAIKDWLLPSFVPLPVMFTVVGAEIFQKPMLDLQADQDQ